MTDDTRIPNMAHAHLPDFLQGAGREVIQFSATVLFYRSIFFSGGVPIAVETGENLVDNNFLFHYSPILWAETSLLIFAIIP